MQHNVFVILKEKVMNAYDIGTKCPITGWEIIRSDYHTEALHSYTVRNQDIIRRIFMTEECIEYAEANKEKIRWLLFKNRIPTIEHQLEITKPNQKLLNSNTLKRIISETYIPETPEDKFNQFFLDISILFPNYEGSIIEEDLLNFSFFKTKYELILFLDAFREKRFLEVINGPYEEKRIGKGSISHSYGKYKIQVKFEGLKYLKELNKINQFSNRCFIAMSFSKCEKIQSIRESLKEVLRITNYDPVLINETYFESDKTINDAIIAEIKKSKFVIADFTNQAYGVYFEAGFALGLGLKVIYCCHKDDFEKTHFDLNHYPHLIYETTAQLKESLKNKIEAWID